MCGAVRSALLRLSEEQEEEDDDEEEKEQRQSGSQRTPLPVGNRGARRQGASHAPGAMTEPGEGGEDEIQFLRTITVLLSDLVTENDDLAYDHLLEHSFLL
ncbi:hypothetical protein STEG23_036605 [Scotinomys teguina]